MATKSKIEPQNPLILRCQRLIEAFGKSDDERDFYLNRLEGFVIYVDLNKPQEDLDALEKELHENSSRYCMIPKLTFYETKKIMEGFVNEKVYDIDTKEKLLDIIQSKEARENFLEFIYDHHSELEKWQQYYQERSRIRIIEWLRNNHFSFVFEEDLDLTKSLIERLKRHLFDNKVGRDILAARKVLQMKAKTYYSNEALNPRPKRGRPPKQAAKMEVEPQISTDIYTTVPNEIRQFLFSPEYSSSSLASFSSKFESEEELLANRKASSSPSFDVSLESLHQKLASLRKLSDRWLDPENKKNGSPLPPPAPKGLTVENRSSQEFSSQELYPAAAAQTKAPRPKTKLKKESLPSKKPSPPNKASIRSLKKVEKKPKTTTSKKVPLRSIIQKPASTKKNAAPKNRRIIGHSKKS
jgi:hypothetical protein